MRPAALAQRLFPERQILVRADGRVSYITLSRRAQITVATGGLAAIALFAFALADPLHRRQAAPEQIQAQSADLRAQIDELQRRLAGANAQLAQAASAAIDASKASFEDAQARIRALEEMRDRSIVEQRKQRQSLQARLRQLETERDFLQARVTELQGQGSLLGPIAPDAAAQAPAAPAQPDAPPPSITDPPSDQRSETIDNSSEAERLLASAGIDPKKLLGRLGSVPPGQGGPYLARGGGSRLADTDARSENWQQIIETLPLGAPLAQYQIESGFGGRTDPFHGRQAFHAGVDMSAPYRSPVYSTAPGTVIFTGVKSNYGKMVEIDHGNDIITRYAHLHRITVARGQRVPVHHKVGEMGSTGRSTGPHLHYEVVVDGTAQDPEKFLQAGKTAVHASGS